MTDPLRPVTRSDDGAVTEDIPMPLRVLAVRFLSLRLSQRIAIATKLGVLDGREDGQTDFERFRHVFYRIRERGLIDELEQGIKAAYKGDPMPDPESWQARVTSICGGATIGEMRLFIESKQTSRTSWEWEIHGGSILPGRCWAVVSIDDIGSQLVAKKYNGSGSCEQEALALAILSAVNAAGEGR